MDIPTILSALSYWFLTWIGIEFILAAWTFMVPADPVAVLFDRWRPTVLIDDRQEEPDKFPDTLVLRRPE